MTAAAAALPVGTEIRSPAGNKFVKVGHDHWQVRGDFGYLDSWTRYSDRDIAVSSVLFAPEPTA